MDEEEASLLAWLKDGEYRLPIMNELRDEGKLPSELAEMLDVSRSSVSRILSDLREKKLIYSVSGKSRTKLYVLTDKGKQIIEKLE